MRYSSLKRSGWHVLTRDHTVLPATDTFIHKWNEPYLPLLPSAERHRTMARSAEGRRLSWPGSLCEIPRWFVRPKTVTHPSTSRGGRQSNSRPSSSKSNAITARPPNHRYYCKCVRCVNAFGSASLRSVSTIRCDTAFSLGTATEQSMTAGREPVLRSKVKVRATGSTYR